MRVKVMNRLYKMSRKEYLGLLKIAGEQVPLGIYAVERNDYAELRCDRCQSTTQLKSMIRQYRAQGFTVHANKGGNLGTAGGDSERGALMSAT